MVPYATILLAAATAAVFPPNGELRVAYRQLQNGKLSEPFWESVLNCSEDTCSLIAISFGACVDMPRLGKVFFPVARTITTGTPEFVITQVGPTTLEAEERPRHDHQVPLVVYDERRRECARVRSKAKPSLSEPYKLFWLSRPSSPIPPDLGTRSVQRRSRQGKAGLRRGSGWRPRITLCNVSARFDAVEQCSGRATARMGDHRSSQCWAGPGASDKQESDEGVTDVEPKRREEGRRPRFVTAVLVLEQVRKAGLG
jgi:hypothetical protein